MIVAAAGNESNRPTTIAPVGHPANCPSILAVAAIDSAMQVRASPAPGLTPKAARSTLPHPASTSTHRGPDDSYRRLNGTSMATPHVAGVVALLAEANPKATVAELKDTLITSARCACRSRRRMSGRGSYKRREARVAPCRTMTRRQTT